MLLELMFIYLLCGCTHKINHSYVFQSSELCDAVKKIQSTFRGKAFRKVDAVAAAAAAVDGVSEAAVVAEAAAPVPEAQTPGDELADIDLADPDLAKAASMIQSKFRVKRK